MNLIVCKHCGKEIEIDEALRHSVEAKVKKDLSKDLEDRLQKDLEAERQKFIKEFSEKQSKDLEILQKELSAQRKKNDEFIQKELELREEKRKIEEEKKQLTLDVERKLDEERQKIIEKTQRDSEESMRMKEKEKDLQIDNLKRMLEDANRKASGVSQQVQGEVLEIDLEEQLRQAFPTDSVEPIAKGVKGGDILQIVKNSMGKTAGTILWETKRAKWTPAWLAKLREDTRKVGASSSILVTEDLPKEISSFGFVETVLVTSYPYAISLAIIVRRGLMQTAAAKSAAENKDETLEMVYQYLQSDAFRHRIEGYVESISTMRIDLDSERRSMERIWKKREMQIVKAELSLSKLSGELEGIMGSAFPTVKQLTLNSSLDDDEKPY